MAKTKISEFSANPANNTDIDSINIAEGCAPSGINDAIRELMAQLKDFQQGTAGDSFNGPVGTTTAAAGAFTTLSASGAVTLSGGTANGVAYLNGSKVLTTGSALTFDGTDLATTGGVRLNNSQYYYGKNAAGSAVRLMGINSGNVNYIGAIDSGPTDAIYGAALTFTNQAWYVGGSEQMRLTSTGLGIGTSSPNYRLTAYKAGATATYLQVANGATGAGAGNGLLLGVDASGNGVINAQGAVNLNITVAGVQRATLDSSGNLLVGTTSHSDGSMFQTTGTTPLNSYRATTTPSGGIYGAYSDVGGTKTVRAYFRVDGGLANYSANDVNLSDERLKKDVSLASNYLEKICSIPVKNFRYKDQSEFENITLGVIAQDVLAVAPELVSEEGFGLSDDDKQNYLSVYQTDLQYALMKCIQEQQAIIEDMKTRLAAAGI